MHHFKLLTSRDRDFPMEWIHYFSTNGDIWERRFHSPGTLFYKVSSTEDPLPEDYLTRNTYLMEWYE